MVHVRFPLIDGKAIHDDVEPSGLVSDALLFEAYRYHASGVIIEGNARFRPRSASATMTASAAVALTEWELTLPSGPYVLNGAVLSTNTKEALLDGNFETGVTTNAPGSIVATCGPRMFRAKSNLANKGNMDRVQERLCHLLNLRRSKRR